MLFLGTGAAELMPNPFCDCDFCKELRANGEIPRKRSAFMVDDETVMDFGPDIMAAAQQYRAPFWDLKNVFITHTHEDHLSFTNLEVLTMTPDRKDKPLHIWLSEKAYAFVLKRMEVLREAYNGVTGTEQLVQNGMLVFHPVSPFRSFTVDGRTVCTVETNHRGCGQDEYSLNYVLEDPDGSKLLYALDTGLYSDTSLAYLSGMKIDTVVMEGTFGSLTLPANANHMTCESLVHQMNNFLAREIITKDTILYITHINQRNRFGQKEYQKWMDDHSPVKTIVAQDGLRV